MTRHSAPVRAARAPAAASPTGWVPYTYCQAHTWTPLACNVDTSGRLNCDHGVTPSAALTISVLTPAARASAVIAARSPPSERLTYQIHIARPLGGGLEPLTATGTSAPGPSITKSVACAISRREGTVPRTLSGRPERPSPRTPACSVLSKPACPRGSSRRDLGFAVPEG